MTNLKEFLRNERGQLLPETDATVILNTIAKASKEINQMVNRAGLLNILGAAGSENIQGEAQQKLDVIANEVLLKAFRECGIIAAVASEEDEHIVETGKTGMETYVLAMDPLDGSSNIDVNVSIGTIFSVYKKTSPIRVSESDFYRKGKEQVLAGYVIYGTSTMLVFSTGTGVNGFTLDREKGDYFLSHPNLRMPADGKIYSINEGNYSLLHEGMKQYIDACKSGNNPLGAPYSARYIGSMVADVHRNILKGGMFLYPGTTKAPKGKLRLLYECHPMAFIVEQAGGQAHSGSSPVLDIQVETLHQRIPVFLGPVNMMKHLLSFLPNEEVVG